MRQIFFIIHFILVGLLCQAQADMPKLQDGDLLFQDLDCGALCDAIESVTEGIDGRDFSHCGLVTTSGDSVFVLEAIGPGVIKTPLEKFIQRSGLTAIVASRINSENSLLIPKAIQFIVDQLGTAYDDAFALNNGKYYCSELIYEAFKHANSGKEVFFLNVMTYKIPDSDTIDPAWENYFEKLKIRIPEGDPGINPGAISRSPLLQRLW